MAGDYKTVVLPSIDVIADDSFEFRRQKHISGFAGRGVFDWTFKFRLIPLLPSAISHPTKPFETPVMAGGLFAIHAKFFWELGGYDEGLNTYGESVSISILNRQFNKCSPIPSHRWRTIRIEL